MHTAPLHSRRFVAAFIIVISTVFLGSSAQQPIPQQPIPQQPIPQQSSQIATSYNFPYKQAGMTDRQAAAYLLDRFTFGARKGDATTDVDAVLRKGLEAWFEEQLTGTLAEPEVTERLAKFTTLSMTDEMLAETFPNAGFVLYEAIKAGVITKDSPEFLKKGDKGTKDSTGEKMNKDYKQKILTFAQSRGYRPKRELLGEMYAQKLLRAVYSPNQLREVLTDFWFNHFNVSITDNQTDAYVMSYERDAIRPNVLGSFGTLLRATAKHPAMLAYLDNAQSTAPEGTSTTLSLSIDTLRSKPGLRGAMQRRIIDSSMARSKRSMQDSVMSNIPEQNRPRKGINENYARELMELHTLGVDGGYTQKDVTEAARVLTGWTIYPVMSRHTDKLDKKQDKLENLINRKETGFVREGMFLFRADAHDATEKRVLGSAFPAGHGVDEGERLLDMLSKNPATAKFICTKLARRFLADEPPASLVERMSATFLATNSNIPAVLRTLASSTEFWSAAGQVTPSTSVPPKTVTMTMNTAKSGTGKKKALAARVKTVQGSEAQAAATATAQATRTKIKSPFELAVSALRAMNADVVRPREVIEWIRKIGQPLYAYQAPTGFPDRAESWINTGSLLNRMNFGLNLALGNIAGVKFDLAALNNNHEPESVDDALQTYAALLLPERNLTETVRLLKPVLADPTFAEKLSTEANKAGDMQEPKLTPTPTPTPMKRRSAGAVSKDTMDDLPTSINDEMPSAIGKEITRTNSVNAGTVAHVVGIILGSPEFQRR
jgi:uncharacterized protein (DUF1800 family)